MEFLQRFQWDQHCLLLWNERPGRKDFAAETLCFVTLARNNCFCTVSSLFVSFAKETCQTCNNNKSHIYCHLRELFAAHTQQFRSWQILRQLGTSWSFWHPGHNGGWQAVVKYEDPEWNPFVFLQIFICQLYHEAQNRRTASRKTFLIKCLKIIKLRKDSTNHFDKNIFLYIQTYLDDFF